MSASQVDESDWIHFLTELYSIKKGEDNSLYEQNVFDPCLCIWKSIQDYTMSESELQSLKTSVSENERMIRKLKSSRAQGVDGLPADVLKHEPELWARVLTPVFNAIIKGGKLPPSWEGSIRVPIYKKGSRRDPRNYRLITLLSIPSKIFARHLLEELEDWVSECGILPREQLGFRKGHSTIDGCFALKSIVKHHITRKTKIYAAYIDMSMAFDTINRGKLWSKLVEWKIPRGLLKLIIQLHGNSWTVVNLGKNGALSSRVETPNGLRQGCILAPILFSIFISDVLAPLKAVRAFPPKLGGAEVPAIFYADDTILLDQTQIGLQRQLDAFAGYCKKNDLIINTQKTQVMVFAGKSNPHQRGKWFIDGRKLVVTREYRYVGVLFSENLSFKAHFHQQELKALAVAGTLKKLDGLMAYKSVTSLRKLYNAKIAPLLLYGTELMIEEETRRIPFIEMKVWKKLLDLPLSSVNSAVRLEIGLTNILAKHWQRVVGYRVALEQAPEDSFRGMLRRGLQTSKTNSWGLLADWIIATLGLPEIQDLASLSKYQLKRLLRETANHWSIITDQLYLQGRPSLAHLWYEEYQGCIQPYLTWIFARDKRRWVLKLRLGQVVRIFVQRVSPQDIQGAILYRCKFCASIFRFPLLHLVLVCGWWQQERRQILLPVFRTLSPGPSKSSELETCILACNDMFLCNRMGAFLSKIGARAEALR